MPGYSSAENTSVCVASPRLFPVFCHVVWEDSHIAWQIAAAHRAEWRHAETRITRMDLNRTIPRRNSTRRGEKGGLNECLGRNAETKRFRDPRRDDTDGTCVNGVSRRLVGENDRVLARSCWIYSLQAWEGVFIVTECFLGKRGWTGSVAAWKNAARYNFKKIEFLP